MKHTMLLLLVLSMSMTNALSQVIFHKQVNFGWLTDLWNGGQKNTLISSIENGIDGCWRSPIIGSKKIEFGGGFVKKEAPSFVLEAFPIPAKGNIPIRIPSLEANSRVMILSLEGQVLYEKQLMGLETWIDINQLKYGYYIVKYEGTNFSWQLPLVKQ